MRIVPNETKIKIRNKNKIDKFSFQKYNTAPDIT